MIRDAPRAVRVALLLQQNRLERGATVGVASLENLRQGKPIRQETALKVQGPVHVGERCAVCKVRAR